MTRKNTGVRVLMKSVLMWGALLALGAAFIGPKLAAAESPRSLVMHDIPVAVAEPIGLTEPAAR